jgi:uncharacterized membrane protein
MAKTSTGLDDNVAGLLCYVLGWISGLVFFLLDKEDKFVRYHAMQSIITFGALSIIGGILSQVFFLGWIISVLGFVLWVILMVKAYQGERYKLPWAGDLAERWLASEEKS